MAKIRVIAALVLCLVAAAQAEVVPSPLLAWGSGKPAARAIIKETLKTRNAVDLASVGSPQVEVFLLASNMRTDHFVNVAPRLSTLKAMMEESSFSLEVPYVLNSENKGVLEVVEKRVAESNSAIVIGEWDSSTLTPNCRLSELENRLRQSKAFENDERNVVVVFLPSFEKDIKDVEKLVSNVVYQVKAASDNKEFVFMLTSTNNVDDPFNEVFRAKRTTRSLQKRNVESIADQVEAMIMPQSLYLSRWPAFALEAFIVCLLLGAIGTVGIYSMANIQTQTKFETPQRAGIKAN